MQFLKPWIETWGLASADARHDPTIRIVAVVIGMIGYTGHAWLLNTLTRVTLSDYLGQGFLAGSTSVAAYHIVAGSASALAARRTGQTVVVVPPAYQDLTKGGT